MRLFTRFLASSSNLRNVLVCARTSSIQDNAVPSYRGDSLKFPGHVLYALGCCRVVPMPTPAWLFAGGLDGLVGSLVVNLPVDQVVAPNSPAIASSVGVGTLQNAMDRLNCLSLGNTGKGEQYSLSKEHEA
jgi:hypothetical protein